MCVTRHAQINQNNKFAISLQYRQKELNDEVGFLHANRHESLLQIDSMILMNMVKHSQSSQNSNFAMSSQHLEKEVKDFCWEIDFLHVDKPQSFAKVYFNTLSIKVSNKVDILSLLMGRIKHHSHITQSNKFAISLQYLKKVVRNEGHWHADKRQSFYKLVLPFLMDVIRHVQITQNRKFVVFLQYIKKNYRNCFLFYCDAKHSDILWGSSQVRCYLFLNSSANNKTSHFNCKSDNLSSFSFQFFSKH